MAMFRDGFVDIHLRADFINNIANIVMNLNYKIM